MKLAVFSAKPYDREYLSAAHRARPSSRSIELVFHDFPLNASTVALAQGASAVCVFVNDDVRREVLTALHEAGVGAILLRCAGYNNVDLGAASALGLFAANVPSYNPESVAEYAVALLQTLNRKTHRAYNRVREGNFALDGLLGRTLHGKTVGIVGVGKIGLALARILRGFGCSLLAFDPFPTDAFREYGSYVSLETLLAASDAVSLHCPLTADTHHIINAHTLAGLKPGALMVNTGRGGLIHTKSVIDALKSRRLGGLALDVYEGEGGLFYNNHDGEIIQDDDLMRLTTFPNVIVSGHQAFFTEEAMTEIAECTLANLEDYMSGVSCKNSLVKDKEYILQRQQSVPVRI